MNNCKLQYIIFRLQYIIFRLDVYTGRVNGKATKDTGRISQRSHDFIDFN